MFQEWEISMSKFQVKIADIVEVELHKISVSRSTRSWRWINKIVCSFKTDAWGAVMGSWWFTFVDYYLQFLFYNKVKHFYCWGFVQFFLWLEIIPIPERIEYLQLIFNYFSDGWKFIFISYQKNDKIIFRLITMTAVEGVGSGSIEVARGSSDDDSVGWWRW